MTSLSESYFLIYQTTNTLNNKIYIGKHITSDLNDSYIGSGKLLKRAIKKYGLENFKTEILFMCHSEEEMNAREKELVTEEFCLREDTYNLCVGGQGGFSYINRSKLQLTEKRAEATKTNFKKGTIASRDFRKNNPEKAKEIAKKIVENRRKNGTHKPFKGKHRDDTIQKMRKKNKRSTAVSIDNVDYDSLTHASKSLDIWIFTLKKRLASDEFPNYKYVE